MIFAMLSSVATQPNQKWNFVLQPNVLWFYCPFQQTWLKVSFESPVSPIYDRILGAFQIYGLDWAMRGLKSDFEMFLSRI